MTDSENCVFIVYASMRNFSDILYVASTRSIAEDFVQTFLLGQGGPIRTDGLYIIKKNIDDQVTQ